MKAPLRSRYWHVKKAAGGVKAADQAWMAHA
jgi:hypothetical protein